MSRTYPTPKKAVSPAATLTTGASAASSGAPFSVGENLPPVMIGFDPHTISEVYGLDVAGQDMEPAIALGDAVALDPFAACGAGDLVVIYKRPELVHRGEHQAIVKRLVVGQPAGMKFPHTPHPESEVKYVLVCESTNPAQRMTIPCEVILAMHRVVGKVVDGKAVAL